MALYIKGLDMPKSCEECSVWSLCYESWALNKIKKDGREGFCPLVEVGMDTLMTGIIKANKPCVYKTKEELAAAIRAIGTAIADRAGEIAADPKDLYELSIHGRIAAGEVNSISWEAKAFVSETKLKAASAVAKVAVGTEEE